MARRRAIVMCGLTLQLLCGADEPRAFRDVLARLNISHYEAALRAEDVGSPHDLRRLSGDDMGVLGLRIGARNRLREWQREQERERAREQHARQNRTSTTSVSLGTSGPSCWVALQGAACAPRLFHPAAATPAV